MPAHTGLRAHTQSGERAGKTRQPAVTSAPGKRTPGSHTVLRVLHIAWEAGGPKGLLENLPVAEARAT